VPPITWGCQRNDGRDARLPLRHVADHTARDRIVTELVHPEDPRAVPMLKDLLRE
ncbi:Hypothetical protein KLENKIAIHU_507, partial [Klenkia terrae]